VTNTGVAYFVACVKNFMRYLL